jgi:hypothetical protein
MVKAGGEEAEAEAEADERGLREVRCRKEVEIWEVEEGRRHWREGREGKVRTEVESSDMAVVAGEEEVEQLEEREEEFWDGFLKAFVSGLAERVWRGVEVSRGKCLGREKGIEWKGKEFGLEERRGWSREEQRWQVLL